MTFHSLLRYFIYLLVCCSTVKGSLPVSRPSDHFPTSANSSPYASGTSQQLYSEWTGWSSCSSTCGLGIITRTRSCLKRVYNSRGVYVPLCHAEYSEHRICNLKTCPPDAPNARRAQCSRHNNRTIAGQLVKEWTPAEEGSNPCELRCKPSSGGATLGFGKVSSGTPCAQGVCLDGRCLKVGCDGLLGSGVSEDSCGVCGGRNATCVHYKDLFQGQPTADQERRSGYHEVVVLPVGARNLKIRQLVGKNYLALQDRTRGIIFNGEQHLTQYGGRYDIAGTTVQFEKSDNTTEILTAKGPVNQELYVLVLLRTFNKGIYYEYWLPRQTHHSTKTQFSPWHRDQKTSTVATSTTGLTTRSTLPTHRPTKPAYAYGYGEKPYRSQDAPVFRHFTPKPIVYGSNTGIGTQKVDVNPLYKPRSFEPAYGYYETFRNVSTAKDTKKVQDLDKELPVLTQPDASGSDSRRYNNDIPNTVLDEKKSPTTAKSQKPTFAISKRGGGIGRNFVTNGRLKYSLESKDSQEVYLNTSIRQTPSPLSIALLPDDNVASREKKSGGDRHRKKTRLSRGGACEPCERKRDQTKHFCESDFVIRSMVVGYEFLEGETRYELEVVQTFKNTLSLLPREFVWSPGTSCRCPRMRPGKEYLVMGRIDNSYRKRESRLLVDRTCFVRTFNLKYARRLQKLKKERTKKCAKTS